MSPSKLFFGKNKGKRGCDLLWWDEIEELEGDVEGIEGECPWLANNFSQCIYCIKINNIYLLDIMDQNARSRLRI